MAAQTGADIDALTPALLLEAFHGGTAGHEQQPSRREAERPLLTISDAATIRFLLADLHDDLRGKVRRLRFLIDLGAELGTHGTMLFGGHVTYHAWVEARLQAPKRTVL